jgi:dipeptidyl-peptidase 4
MKKLFFTLFTVTPTFILTAQTKLLTMEDAVRGQRTYLAPQKLEQLGWIPGTDQYYYVEKDQLMVGNAATGKQTSLLSLNSLNSGLKATKNDTLTNLPWIVWFSGEIISFEIASKKIFYHIKEKRVVDMHSLDGKTSNTDESVKHDVAYTIENNLFIKTLSSGFKSSQITKDPDPNILNGHSVHRDEWGIHKGTFWSPKGNYLAFYRMDQTMVTDYPVINFRSQPAKNENIKYPMAGMKSHHVTVGVYDLKTQKTIFLKTGGDPEHYLTNVCWSPDEKHIYMAELNRAQTEMKFNCYNAQTGEFVKTLFEEKNEKYVQPLHTMTFVKNHPDLFIWQSTRNGYNNLYLYKTDGTLVRQLTNYAAPNEKKDGYTIVTDVLGFDEKGEHVFYCAAKSYNILGRAICKASIDGQRNEPITRGDGTHSGILSPNGKFIIDSYSAPNTPRVVSIIDPMGFRKHTLLDAPNPLKDYKLGQIRVFTIKAADNSTDLFCRMIMPVDFDSTKKYPALTYLYNGPGVQLITNTWLSQSDLWFQYMAQRGFIVFTVDGRGSANRGQLFEQAIFRNVGKVEMDDQLKGVEFLKSKSYVDASRMGVFGWSYGGFMTTSLMTRHPGVFKVGVAGGPVIDWSYYEVMYTERYMDTPLENPEGYKESSLLNYAGNLKGKLLLIHGSSDPVVVWQHSLLFLEKCVEKKTYPDYLVYPGHEHNVLGPDRTHLYEKITEYFMQHL